MASIPAKKRASISDHPCVAATITPMFIIEKMMVRAAIMGAIPILSIFLNEKSRPKAKSRNITPMSAQVCIFSSSRTDTVRGILGDTMMPATI